MNRDYPWFAFYPKDWVNDSQLSMASLASQGIWIRFLCVAYHAPEPGRLAGTIERLARVIGCSREEFVRFVEEARELRFADICEPHPGTLDVACRRMQRDDLSRRHERENNAHRKRRQRRRDAQRDAAVTDDVTRGVAGYVAADPDPHPNPDSNPNAEVKSRSDSANSDRRATVLRRPDTRAAALSEDFALDLELRTYAKSKGFDPDQEIEKFRAHYLSTGQVRKDWRRAFQSWVLKALEFRAVRKSHDPAGMIVARMRKTNGAGI